MGKFPAKKRLGRFAQTGFVSLLTFYLILFILENLFTGFVSNNFDLNILLIPIFIFGCMAALFPVPKQKQRKATKLDYLSIIFLTSVTFVIVLTKTSMLGRISIILSFTSSILVLFISLIVLITE